jgi:hypothetical protein
VLQHVTTECIAGATEHASRAEDRHPLQPRFELIHRPSAHLALPDAASCRLDMLHHARQRFGLDVARDAGAAVEFLVTLGVLGGGQVLVEFLEFAELTWAEVADVGSSDVRVRCVCRLIVRHGCRSALAGCRRDQSRWVRNDVLAVVGGDEVVDHSPGDLGVTSRFEVRHDRGDRDTLAWAEGALELLGIVKGGEIKVRRDAEDRREEAVARLAVVVMILGMRLVRRVVLAPSKTLVALEVLVFHMLAKVILLVMVVPTNLAPAVVV